MCTSLLPPTARRPQFSVCANSSLRDYAKIFPRNNHTVDVDIYQGVSARRARAARATATPTRGGASREGRGHASDHTPPPRA